jgi:glucose/arabinose dehydrogenase
VNYTAGNPLQSRISRFAVTAADAMQADPGSEQVLLAYQQPLANHNGGKIAFGPDGLLYIAVGDGGGGGDPQNNAQNRTNLLGSILRIDVNASTGSLPYAIPGDNPFVGNTQGYREEIFAFGLRNPWKFSFDHETGKLWAADVGQNRLEEINIIEKGGNYGWRIMEGTACYNPSQNCNQEGLLLPVYEYAHSAGIGRSITGGYVYRGTRLPALQGHYIYGDYISGNIWALSLRENGTVASNTLLANAGFLISSFGEDHDREILVLSHGPNRKIWRLADIVTGMPAEAAEAVDVFPNPAMGSLSVRWPGVSFQGAGSLTLYNAVGQQAIPLRSLDMSQNFEATLDISGLAKGVYTLWLEAGERRIWRKVLIQ